MIGYKKEDTNFALELTYNYGAPDVSKDAATGPCLI